MKLFEKNNIIIIRLSSLGDTILTSPVVAALRTALPKARIDFLTSNNYKGLVQFNPHIDNVWSYEKSSIDSQNKLKEKISNSLVGGKYDVAIDLQNNHRSARFINSLTKHKLSLDKNRLFKLFLVHLKTQIKAPKHVVERYADVANKLCPMPELGQLELWLPEETEYNSTLKQSGKICFGIAPGATHFTKRYPKDKFIELIKSINREFDCSIKLFGGKEDMELCDVLSKVGDNITNYAGKTTIIETAIEIDKIDLMICNDTGLMHIATARRKPIVAIFGSTVPELGFTPYKATSQIVEVPLSCRPCTHIGRSSCPKQHFNCMNLITSEMIVKEIKTLIVAAKII